MKKYNARAVVLKSVKYKDSDKIYTLFTKEYGKISAIARGVRKISSRRSGNLDTLNLVSVSFRDENLGHRSIEEVKTIESFRNLKKDLQKSTKAYYMAEIIYKSVEEDEQVSNIFNLFVKCLKTLDKNNYPGDLVISHFEMNLMNMLGYRITFDVCGKCGRKADDSWNKYFFNIEDGCLECEGCSKYGIGVKKDAAIGLKNIFNGKISKEEQLSAKEVDKILKMYVGRKLEARFKSLEIQ
jgi:DNA repair protein RecO (recombination protein O)